MKCILIYANGYNYKAKDGTQKVGKSLIVSEVEEKYDNDGNGNFSFGRKTANVYARKLQISDTDLKNLIGKEIRLDYEMQIGNKYMILTGLFDEETKKTYHCL